MKDPLRLLAVQFRRISPDGILAFGTGMAVVEFIILFAAAHREGVLHIPNGVGFFDNYGLMSTIVGNALLPYLARRYYAEVCKLSEFNNPRARSVIGPAMSQLETMMSAGGRYRFILYLLTFVGLLVWVSNTSFHLLGLAEVHWGHKVFDSIDHPGSFVANRISNFYTWVIVLPFGAMALLCSTIQLRKTIMALVERKALDYDLLHQDRQGGFGFLGYAHIVFNLALSIVYIQIALHTETFYLFHLDHVVSFAVSTFVLLFGNSMFLGGTFRSIRKLRDEAIRSRKSKTYRNDRLSFEILKFAYEARPRSPLISFGIRLAAIAISLAIKIGPALPRLLRF